MRWKFWEKAQKKSAVDPNKEAADHFRQQAALEPATTKEYADWLERYLEDGGVITGFVDRNMAGDDVLVARQDALLPNIHGNKAFRFIVPSGIDIATVGPVGLNAELGENMLYLPGGVLKRGYDTHVKLYRDTVWELKQRGCSLSYLCGCFNNFQGDVRAFEKAFFENPKITVPSKSTPGLK